MTASAFETLSIDDWQLRWYRHPRRRRAALRVEQGQISLHTPMRFPKQEAQRFVRQQSQWLKRQQAAWHAMPDAPDWRPVAGAEWPYLGEPLRLVLDESSRLVRRDDHELLLGCAGLQDEAGRFRRLHKWYRQQAELHLQQQLALWSDHLGLSPSDCKIRRYKRRWGSCHGDGRISLNWCLIMAPQAVLDYVIIHELCHLQYFNHSSAFWSLVQRYCPEWRQHRRWLADHGHCLDFPYKPPPVPVG